MPTFQKKALGVAVFILVVFLIVISIALVKDKSGVYSKAESCPDYWMTFKSCDAPNGCCPDNSPKNEDGTCSKDGCFGTEYGCCGDNTTAKTDAYGSNCPVQCYNTKRLGTVSSTCTSIPESMDFSDSIYTGSSGLCNKQKWAKQCGLTWDGITTVSSGC